MSTKYIKIEQGQNVWMIPVSFVAAERAKYYAAKDKDTTYQDEFDFVMGDAGEALDWLENNMNYEDWKDAATLSQKPQPATFDFTEDYETSIEVA